MEDRGKAAATRLGSLLVGLVALAAVPAPCLAGLPSMPVEVWRWDGRVEDPVRSWPTAVIAVPLSDDDGDGDIDRDDGPDVAFLHFQQGFRPTQSLAAVDGRTGEILFDVSSPRFGTGSTLDAVGPLAAADIDGDGIVELLVSSNEVNFPTPEPAQLIAFEHDGTHAWSRDWPGSVNNYGQAIGIADLNQDGVAEAHLLGTVLSVDGSLAWSVTETLPGLREYACFSQVVDLDPTSPGLELLYGANLFSATGDPIWGDWFNPMGATAIGDVDGDGDPEIAVVERENLYLYDHLGVQVGPTLQTGPRPPSGARPSAPCIGDVDGDGLNEIVLAANLRFVAFGWDGSALVEEWAVPWNDPSGLSGPALFDFDGDGASEIVGRDQSAWRIMDGTDGATLHEEWFPSRTGTESPIVFSTGDDCGATIVVGGFGDIPTNDGDAVDSIVAFRVEGGPAARRIWNQRTYHVTNVDEDGRIPLVEQPPWELGLGWQSQVGTPGGGSTLTFDTAWSEDPSDCNLGLLVSWDAAVPEVPSDLVVYDVYRSDDLAGPTCEDALSRPPLVTGVSDLSWWDATTEPEREYVHVVQARLAVGCAAPAVACTEPIVEHGEPQPEGVFAVLRVAHSGHDVELRWDAARTLLGPEHFHLLKAVDSPLNAFARVNDEASLERTWLDVDTGSSLQFFDVRVANGCEELSADEYPPTVPR